MGLNIPDEEKTGFVQEDQPPKNSNGSPSDSSGFGLVNWLFDHINERKPVFLSLYRQYDAEVKISSDHRIISWFLLVSVIILDMILFVVYAMSIIAIIVGITFIFVKGTGLLDLVSDSASNQQPSSSYQITEK